MPESPSISSESLLLRENREFPDIYDIAGQSAVRAIHPDQIGLRLKADGTPEAVPFYPHEFSQRQSFLGALDPSSQPVKGVSPKDLDPLQRLRIRDAIRKYSGDQALLALNDSELDGALGITCTENGNVYPTLAGVLLLGTEELLLRHIPTHEVAFQLLHGTDVQVNEFFRKPLLQTFEEIELEWLREKE